MNGYTEEEMGSRIFNAPTEETRPCEECGALTHRFLCSEACENAAREKDWEDNRRHNWLGWIETSIRALPASVRDVAFESPELVRLVGVATIAAAQKQGAAFVTFHGPSGAGKTALAACKWTEAIRRTDPRRYHFGLGSHYASAISLVRDEGDLEPSRYARTTDILLLDDVGLERSTPFGIETIRDIVYSRHATVGLVTYVTTPLSKVEASSRYGDGFARRLFENAIHIEAAQT